MIGVDVRSWGGSDARRIARVDAGLLDVLHDAADDDALAVATTASTSTSNASSRKRVEQDRVLGRRLDGARAS